MNFEEDIAKLNEFYFFREFTFSENTFRLSPTQEVELADNIVWLDEPLIIYQLKERQAQNNTTPENEQKWFKRNIIGLAKQQIRDTLNYLQSCNDIEIQNRRGHKFKITVSSLASVHKLILYKAHESLPESCKKLKYHRSQTAGFIHLISSDNYLGIVKTLLTPVEIADYLSFREMLIKNWEETSMNLPEQALVGQYLSGESKHEPNFHFIEYLQKLDHRIEEWDMSRIINSFLDRIITDNHTTDYYYIVREIAKLRRNELREFKTRCKLSMEKTKANECTLPYRIASPRTGCGFIFVPLMPEDMEGRQQFLQNLTYAHKYDQKLPKCIGVSFAPDGDNWYSVEWFYKESPWEYNLESENILKNSDLFRPVRGEEITQYTFSKGAD